jgi:hypothetical protein
MSTAVAMKPLTPDEIIDRRIYVIREQRVMLDRDLAALYGVKPIALRQQVRRNLARFPKDFMFTLSAGETSFLLSQNVIRTRPDQQTSGPGQHRHHAGLRPHARTHVHPSGSPPQNRRHGTEIRRPIPIRLRRPPRSHGTATRPATQTDRLRSHELTPLKPQLFPRASR